MKLSTLLAPFFLLIVILLISCTSKNEYEIPEYIKELENLTVYDLETESRYQINMEFIQEFGNNEDVILGYPWTVIADEQGQIYIHDLQQRQLFTFNSSGDFTGTIGREGSGPEEFNAIGGISYGNKKLVIYDGPLRRFTYYSISAESEEQSVWEFEGIIFLSGWDSVQELSGYFLFPINFSITQDGGVVTAFKSWNSDGPLRFFSFGQDGKLAGEMIYEMNVEEFRFENEQMQAILPMSRKALFVLDSQDNFIVANTDKFLIKTCDLKGNYKSSFYYPYQNLKVNRENAIKRFPANRVLADADLPETWPVLDNMIIDDKGRLWVGMLTEAYSENRWKILSNNGEQIAEFMLPTNKEIKSVLNKNIYVEYTDSDTGERLVRQYGFNLELR